MDKNKLNAKDFINIGIFTVIYFVMFFIAGMMGYIPIFAVMALTVFVLLPGEWTNPALLRGNLDRSNHCGWNRCQKTVPLCSVGSEKQKIACASVSAMEPDIFVLDEPSSNLDIQAIGELKRVLQKWKAQRKTIVIAEHRLYYLMDIADRVLYMENLHLSGFQDAHPMSLSGGHMKEVADNLRQLSALGKTLFIVTHDPGRLTAFFFNLYFLIYL